MSKPNQKQKNLHQAAKASIRQKKTRAISEYEWRRLMGDTTSIQFLKDRAASRR
ncbi:hypothetical protein [Brevibacillus laterosporus]|uniref:hypothetical protein n=1 Tax=Brevibacillus laterosporus TaxID=1465 RepID=UPI002651C5FD|nr:hypothetical protein [Brevibacillus laterosporus]MDN9012573.1 hypothetical protein [Brevibacillus laterosporus]MDO0943668.1 hypothetical protein [Brevibacillus laterosporus]